MDNETPEVRQFPYSGILKFVGFALLIAGVAAMVVAYGNFI